ncbi:aminoglycoside phosphotransferase family protein [Marinilabiliaceae bacterium ANBcel2]|nr:aminoglycoside phosphotransferase family protein [Marinilabiliaceae bacterium ANBcel2]
MSTDDLKEIINEFKIEGVANQIKPFGSGHIHDTFLVTNGDLSKDSYILQKINTSIFQDVDNLMENIRIVTDHLQKKAISKPGADPKRDVLTLIPAKSGKSYIKDEKGSYWRVFVFIADTNSYDLVETDKQAFEGGKGYGGFFAELSDLDATRLHEILPDFHNVVSRFSLLEKAISSDPAGRVADVEREISFVKERIDSMRKIHDLGEKGALPLKTTHNDTKFNNVLLNSKDEAQCVIDLDTVMPGYVAFDFGDAIRTIVNTAEEDEKELSKIDINLSFFESFAKGFISAAGDQLSKIEAESLAEGSLLLPYIIGMRFLTDHIDGDNYYKIGFPGHNLQRARAQFRLVEKLEENSEKLRDIVMSIYADNKKG